MRFNEIEARKLWNLLGFGEQRLAEMRCIDMDPACPKDKKCKARTVTTSVEGFLEWGRTWNGKGNCFVGRNPRKPDHSTAVKEISVVTLDLDPIRDKDAPATAAQTEECVNAGRKILERFNGGSLALSGNGCLLIWSSTAGHPLSKDFELKLANFQDECRRLISEYKGVRIDDTQDSARLIKLLGTVSVKGEVRPTRFLHVGSGRGGGDSLFRHISSLDIARVPGTQGPDLDRKAVDTSGSGRDFRLALILAKEGATDEEILAALADNPLGRNDRKDDHVRILQKIRQRIPYRGQSASVPVRGGDRDIVLHSPKSSLAKYKESFEQRGKHDKPELSTGFEEFDRATHGLRRSEIYTVAARPAVGKSSYLLNVAHHLCAGGKRVLLLSTEMPYESIWDRIFSIGCEVGGHAIARGKFTPEEKARVDQFTETFERYDLHVCDSFQPDIGTVESAVRQTNPDVLLFDHIQHIGGGNPNEVKLLADFTRGLKSLAMRANCAVLVASQLRRPQQIMDFKTKEVVYSRPSMSDLKGCGTIEEESAFVLLLSNTGAYMGEHEPIVSAELAKNRFGPNVQTELVFYKNITKFKSIKEE